MYSVIVPAAGIGSRMQADRPKQYLPLAGRTVLEVTLERLISHHAITRIVLVLHPDDDYFPGLPIANAPWLLTVTGGDERADSVYAGLSEVAPQEWVLVHDAARPCITHEDIDRLLQLQTSRHGGILAVPVRDTIKQAKNNQQTVAQTVPRDDLWHALTPQLFRAGLLKNAIETARASGLAVTDEASAMECLGLPVALVEGRDDNIKITRPADLALAAYYLQQQGDAQ